MNNLNKTILKNRILIIGKRLLLVWGTISFIGVIILAFMVMESFEVGKVERENKARKTDVVHVLNWCELGAHRIDQVTNSFTSGFSFNGDHRDFYAIRIIDVKIEELSSTWYHIDSLPPVLDEAVKFVGGWSRNLEWFPDSNEIRNGGFYIYPWHISFNGVSLSDAQLIFLDTTEKMVYYVSIAT